MTRPIYAAIIALLCALCSWIYWETKAPPRPMVTKPVGAGYKVIDIYPKTVAELNREIEKIGDARVELRIKTVIKEDGQSIIIPPHAILSFDVDDTWKDRAIRSGPPRNEPHIVDREWPRWKEPEVKDCLQRKDPDCGGVIYSLEEWEKWMRKHRMERE